MVSNIYFGNLWTTVFMRSGVDLHDEDFVVLSSHPSSIISVSALTRMGI